LWLPPSPLPSLVHGSFFPIPSLATHLLGVMDSSKVQSPNHVYSCGHLVLPEAAQLVQEVDLNVNGFISHPCSPLGE
jgi:hypothetical protein